jgi:FKBP-type peptidyl-prolyl cis-trans isomerase
MKALPILLAVLVAITAYFAWKPESIPAAEVKTGSDLFTQPASADVIAGLRVVEWDDPSSSAKIIEVKRTGNDWVIPSHFNYPADANTRVSKSAATFLGLKHGRLVTDDSKQFESLGVIDPLDENLSQKTGRGKRITMTDITGQVVADLILGKRDETGEGIYYMREAGKNQVYTVAVQPDLSTKFVDYVEVDPLKVKRDDIRSLMIADYSVDAAKHSFEMRSETQVARPNGTDAWTTDGPVPPDKKINQGTMNTIITAATTVKLTDVREFSLKTSRDIMEMQSKGFFFVPPGTVDKDSPVVSLSNQGQGQDLAAVGNEGRLTISTKDGLRYSLMFGEVALDTDSKDAKPQDPAQKPDAGHDRYMVVFVQYDAALDEDSRKPPAKDEKPKPSGQERAAKAQARYLKYYYVISDEAFKQLRPALDKVFEAKPAEAKVGTTGKSISEWMADNGKLPGVKTTPSGLEYEVMTPGKPGGRTPGPTDRVAVRYKGTLYDGTQFDASKEVPATFPVNGVVKGFGEGLQLMSEGAKYKLYIKPDLGYGESSMPKIPANSVLIFEVELVSILGAAAPPPPPSSYSPTGVKPIQAHLGGPTTPAAPAPPAAPAAPAPQAVAPAPAGK